MLRLASVESCHAAGPVGEGGSVRPQGGNGADLVFLVAGVIGIALGELVTVAGVHARQSTDNAGNPVLGNIIAALRLLVVVVSVILGIANLVIWVTPGVAERSRPWAKPDDEDDLLQTIRDDGHRDRTAR